MCLYRQRPEIFARTRQTEIGTREFKATSKKSLVKPNNRRNTLYYFSQRHSLIPAQAVFHCIYWFQVHFLVLVESETRDLPPVTYDDNIIYLADPDAKMKTWVRPTAYPCLIFVDENMNLQVHSLRGVEDAIDAVYDRLESK